MSGPVRKTVAAVSSVAAAVVVLWVVGTASWGWLPDDDGARWTVGTAVGAVVAAAVLFTLAAWASAPAVPAPAPGGRRVSQAADGRDDAVIEQAAGHRVPPAAVPGAAAPLDEVDQRAKGKGRARIRQTGGDDQP
ncbi:hypothetical protein C8250_008955 [Streptomyces sp. So13.3]|uniref:hypothetical protein n=1 Tax=Streptomyces sp. So13.3 TaxID=2136173 RepID=UPI001106514D|nr:hypothetical protein [Streptomyces sp. So13.3]QNA72013.1 hypothetical protein C8250_008955 [Streptomyces sp. So13.3]